MKIDVKNYVETTFSGGHSFGIEQSPKIFKVLSKNIYKNAIMAFIRELTTNAADAHIDAGTQDTPIDIKLPNKLEPSFYVRDYGTGLSKEDLIKIYTTYFRSTKSGDNLTDGMYGLGSKSPFAYSSDFTVDSYFNGKHFSYLAMFDENDCPIFVPLIDGVDTTEKNGLKVSITIKVEDIAQVCTEAIRVLAFVDEEINLIALDEHISKYKACKDWLGGTGDFADAMIYEDEHVKILSEKTKPHFLSISKYNILQGNVRYPLEFSSLQALQDLSVAAFANSNSLAIVFFKFNRGDINVPPSREEISYDRTYIMKIVEKSEKALKNVIASTETEFTKIKTYFEYIKFSKKLNQTHAAIFSSLFYSQNNITSFSDIVINIPNPYDSSFTHEFDLVSVLSQIKTYTFDPRKMVSLHLDEFASKLDTSIGTVKMHRHIYDMLKKQGIIAPVFEKNAKDFECSAHYNCVQQDIVFSVDLSFYEKHSDKPLIRGLTRNYEVANNDNVVVIKVPVQNVRSYNRQRKNTLYLVFDDNVKNLKMRDYASLMSEKNNYDAIIFFKNDFKKSFFEKLDKITQKINETWFSAPQNSFKQIISSTSEIAELFPAKISVYKGISITAHSSVRVSQQCHEFMQFSEKYIANDIEIQKLIESKKYLIVKTFATSKSISVEIDGKTVKLNDGQIRAAILSYFMIHGNVKYDGYITINKTSFDKLSKKVDLKNLMDTELTKMFKDYEFLGYANILNKQYSFINMHQIIELQKSRNQNTSLKKKFGNIFECLERTEKLQAKVKALHKIGINYVSHFVPFDVFSVCNVHRLQDKSLNDAVNFVKNNYSPVDIAIQYTRLPNDEIERLSDYIVNIDVASKVKTV